MPNYDDDSYIGVNENGLFSINIFDDDVTGNIQTWVHDEGDTFRKQRADGTLAEPISFERDATGKIVSVVQYGYRSLKRQ
ncbi:hypothetical protein [Glaciecola sp. SC05]|uniref:hypothetical protein n=1 Tax=Glaciecola sp. SC05 TaxID=1987355 RepID=UPI0035278436